MARLGVAVIVDLDLVEGGLRPAQAGIGTGSDGT